MKFREFKTTSGKLVLAGRNAESNEKLIKQVQENEIVLHTSKPGSPFVNIKARTKGSIYSYTMKDIREAAVFCAAFSQAWKKAKKKKDVEVHIFLGKDIFKLPGMKQGTFSVRRHKTIKVKKEEIEKLDENRK